jgi:hypothetical protein
MLEDTVPQKKKNRLGRGSRLKKTALDDEENDEYDAAVSAGNASDNNLDYSEDKLSRRANRKQSLPKKRTRNTAKHMPEPDYFLSEGDDSDDGVKSN